MSNGFAPVTRLLPSPVGRGRGLDATAPSVQRHYGAFSPTTGRSAPVPRVGTLGLAGVSRSAVSLGIGATGSPVPRESLTRGHAAFGPDAARAGLQDSARAHPGATTGPGSDVDATLSAVHRRFALARLLGPHLTGSRPAFSATLTTHRSLRQQLAGVWSRLLIAGSEGPSLISHAASAPPFVGAFQDTRWPQYLQCTASGSCRCRPHAGQGKRTLAGRKTACTRRTNSEMPTTMTSTDSSRPCLPTSVTSPKPVVVSVATVK